MTAGFRLALADLSPTRQGEVQAALAAVETADAPVPAAAFRALQDPTMRSALEGCLSEAGRVLLCLPGGYLSGYDDGVAERLARDGLGVLPPDDRAVLALVLLLCVAVPRSAGQVSGTSWLDAKPTSYLELDRSQIPNTRVRESVRRLRHCGLLRFGARKQILPGPQFARFTEATSDRLWEDLILLAAPSGVLADVIRRRRTARRNVPTTSTPSEPGSRTDPAAGEPKET